MIQLKIKVTKEILERTMYCDREFGISISNCAIAVSVRTIWPGALIHYDVILPFGDQLSIIRLPQCASSFINEFDNAIPSERTQMPELEFTVDIPDAIVDCINIDELRPLLINHPTLELV